MSLRITDPSQLEHVSPHVREQLERHLGHVPVIAPSAPTPGEPRARLGRPEQDAGKQLVDWIDLLVLPNGLRPGLFFCHTANGGWRTKAEAGILIGQGVRVGWPDYTLYIPQGRYHGLVLELKALNGPKPRQEQLDILARLESVGFCARVAWGFDEAKRAIEDYLGIP